MNNLVNEVYEYLKLTWFEESGLELTNHLDVESVLVNYGIYMKRLVPINVCTKEYMKYIHKERILYDQYHNDEIACFLYDVKDEESGESDSMYSESELETDSEPESFIGGFKVMDEFDFREQLSANKFTGGYWDPKIHWVISKKQLYDIVNNN